MFDCYLKMLRAQFLIILWLLLGIESFCKSTDNDQEIDKTAKRLPKIRNAILGATISTRTVTSYVYDSVGFNLSRFCF